MSTTAVPAAEVRDRSESAHWELVRALGAAVLTPPPGSAAVWRGLALPIPSGADHTGAFVLGAPPHAAIHLGAEGKLGGDGLDRVGGFWRALGLRAPEDADHLGALLMLYADLGAAADASDGERSRALGHARAALLHEHLWSWAPGYLESVSTLGVEPITAWADLTLGVLTAERADAEPASGLPAALREAAAPLAADGSLDDALDALVAPVRTGFVLTQRDLHEGARVAGVGFRRGERRYALHAMMQQDARATLGWLRDHAEAWAERHDRRGSDPTSRWWHERAAGTAQTLGRLYAEAPR